MPPAERSSRTDPRLRALRDAILRTFGGEHCPPRGRIAPHECADCDALARAFAGVGWRKMPDGLIEAYASKLPLLSPEAFHYFLPAYLLYALDHFTPDAKPTEFVIYCLAVREQEHEEMIDCIRERSRPFTREEIDLAAAFLDLAREDASLRRYHGEDIERGRQRLLAHWDARWNA
jgi:hypothetical protein